MASDFYSQPRSRYIEAVDDQLKTLDMNVNLTETLNLTVLIVLSNSQPMLTYILTTEEVNLFSGSVEQKCRKRKRSK